MRFPIVIPTSLRVAIAVLWLAATVAAWLVLPQNIAPGVRIPFLIAACAELFFFVSLGWPSFRQSVADRFPPQELAFLLCASAVIPYGIYMLGTGAGTIASVAALTAIVVTGAFWYIALPWRGGVGGALVDAGFLTLIGMVMLGDVFGAIYPDAAPKLQAEFLGRLMWIRLGVSASLLLRKMPGTGFGFWPTAREWRVGVLGFLLLMPVLLALGWSLDFFSIRELTRPVWQMALITVGSFLGFLWVVSLSEEFFLRGLLQQWVSDWTRSNWTGLAITALVSGSVHLPFGGQFPNWKFAALATVAHAGYGLAFQQGKGIRAAMVTHALVVTVWRVFLR